MPIPNEIEEMPGAVDLYEWFGYWPEFHDAEILSLHLNRTGISQIRLHTWEMTSEIDDHGFYVLRKHVIIEFTFENIRGVDLAGFNHQNVISELAISRTNSGFRVDLGACYGLAGSIIADKIALRLMPGKPLAG